MKKILCLLGLAMCVTGCSSHSIDPNLKAMQTISGELDRETAH